MQRVAAVSKQLAGSQGLWAGVTIVAPNVASGIHHHGETETVIYVVSGHAKMRWGDRMQVEEDVEPGDFIYVPPFAPHQEINPSPYTPSQWMIVRKSQEPIVVNLEPFDVAQPWLVFHILFVSLYDVGNTALAVLFRLVRHAKLLQLLYGIPFSPRFYRF